MRERDLQAKVVGYARGAGLIARKLDFGEGWPDVMFLHKGRVLFMEFKQLTGRTTPLQQHMHRVLREHGFTVLVVRDVDHGYKLINDMLGIDQPDTLVVDYMGITKQLSTK